MVWKVVALSTTTPLMHGGTFNGHSCVNSLLSPPVKAFLNPVYTIYSRLYRIRVNGV